MPEVERKVALWYLYFELSRSLRQLCCFRFGETRADRGPVGEVICGQSGQLVWATVITQRLA